MGRSPGRPPLGDKAMTGAERLRRWRERQREVQRHAVAGPAHGRDQREELMQLNMTGPRLESYVEVFGWWVGPALYVSEMSVRQKRGTPEYAAAVAQHRAFYDSAPRDPTATRPKKTQTVGVKPPETKSETKPGPAESGASERVREA
jgi:hypothetical protein